MTQWLSKADASKTLFTVIGGMIFASFGFHKGTS